MFRRVLLAARGIVLTRRFRRIGTRDLTADNGQQAASGEEGRDFTSKKIIVHLPPQFFKHLCAQTPLKKLR
jgi:hypothetical protein